VPPQRDDEDRLRARLIVLAHAYGRYGYRRITALLQPEGGRANHKRVARRWRQEGLTGPQKQPQRARLWLADGSCIRRRAEYPNPVWSYDCVRDRTQDGRPLKRLTVVEAYTRECLAMAVRRRLTSREVQEVLSEWFLHRGGPTHIRSDNGPECIARALRAW
jgi:transposase InsO family protein